MPTAAKNPQPHHPPPTLHVFDSHTALGIAAARDIAACAVEAIATRGRFTVAISGGSLPKLVFPALAAAVPSHRWAHWFIFWADERLVPPEHPDSNLRLAKEMLFDRVSIPPQQIFAVDTTLPADAAARKYQKIIETTVGAPPRFDAILLGIGPDGHTASLFPGHSPLAETVRAVAPVLDSPKPPPKRVTLTLPVLKNARCIFFIATGESKADILPRVLLPAANSQLPAAMVQSSGIPTHWYVDVAAAQKI